MQTRSQKEEIVQAVEARVRESKALVFAQYSGVTVKDLDVIREELSKSGSKWQVLKKTLLKIVLDRAGVAVNPRELDGQVGVAFSTDEVSAAKVLAEFVKKNKDTKLTLLGGSLGMKSLSVSEVKALAKLPSRDELRGQLVGTLQAPISGFVRVLSGNLSGLVTVLKAVADEKEKQQA